MPRNNSTLLLLILLLSTGTVFSQTKTQTEQLKTAYTKRVAMERATAEKLQVLAQTKKWPMTLKGRNGSYALLVDVDPLGNPVYLTTDNNIRAAATIGTNQLWPGGSLNLSLSGGSNIMKSKLAVWDGGRVRPTHQELTGRVNNKDAGANSDHSTHVAGTMMAKGINPLAKGMAYNLQELIAYDFNDHISEMLLEANGGLLISNHSYGEIAGWYYNEGVNPARWEFRGAAGENEDYKFGFYSTDAQAWDEMAFNAPEYLIVKSSGNNRDVNGPAVGEPYYRYDAGNVMGPAGNRPAGISNNDGFDIIATYGTAKNILTIGAVDPISSGYNKPSDVVLAEFSSWGPTDDGRIKPDVVANGVDVLSAVATSDNAYATFSGTSMATPNASGSLGLLQEYYAQLNSSTFMRSASLKGLVIHTADEAGPSNGPDYKHGWGLINMVKAAEVIKGDNLTNQTHSIQQLLLTNVSPTYLLTITASGKGPLVATICWTDPKGTVTTTNRLNNTASKLINDLDLRVRKEGTAITYLPWILNPASRNTAATKGDNFRDNVEKIEIPDAVPGAMYTIEVTRKNTLTNGQQAFSLILSGIGGTAYCTSAPFSAAPGKIDSVSFGGIKKKNAADCNGYRDYTNLTAEVEPGSTIPLYVAVGSCNGSTNTNTVKAFIDFNGDGTFGAGEMVGNTNALTGAANGTINVTIPGNVIIGNTTIMRVIAQQTANPADINACGVYNFGETQDFRVKFIPASNDLGVTAIAAPAGNRCPNPVEYVTVRIKNFGNVDKSNITLTGTVKNGAATVQALSGTFPGTIPALGEITFTFSTPFATQAGITYTINCKASAAGDQVPGNDEKTTNVTISADGATPAGEAEICNTSVLFKPATGSTINYWYDSPSATVPIAAGNINSSNVITADKKYYLATNLSDWGAGAATRTTLGTGSFNTYNNTFITLKAGAPLTIETVRLYIAAGNTSGKAEVILGRNFSVSSGSYSYNKVASTVIDIYPTDQAQGAVFYLGLSIPTAGDYGLIISQADGENATFFSNTNIATNPYTTGLGINGVFQVTGNYQKLIAGNTTWPQFYFVFYDLRVRQAGCASGATKTVVTAGTPPVPVITLTGNVFSSTLTSGNQWYLDGNPITGATNQTYTTTIPGNYKVVVRDAFNCTTESNTIPYAVTSVPNVDPTEIGLKIYPNPSDGKFFTEFTVRTKATLSVSIMNAVGQKVYETIYPDFVGKFNETIQAGNLASGVYLLRIQHDNKSYLKKLFVR